MNYRTLQQFLILAESLHFGRASTTANVSVSALSRNIRQLEEELATTLFIRDNRSVSITADGKSFQEYAKTALQNWQQIKQEIANRDGDLRGEISLYCSVTASYSILFNLLNALREAHPAIEINLHTGDPNHAIQRVTNGSNDLCIAALPPSLPADAVFKHITYSNLLFIGPKESKDPAVPINTPVTRQQWQQAPMILAETGLARSRVDAWFAELEIKPRIYAQVTGNEAIVSMVSLGLGIGVVPELVLQHSPMAEHIQVLAVKQSLAPYDVGLVTMKKTLKTPLVAAFWQLL